MASELRQRSIKISDATWERWQAQAGTSSVTALIVKSVDAYPAALAEIVALQADSARLKQELAAVRSKAATVPGDADRFEELGRQLGMWQARAERAEQAAKVIAHSPAVVIGADPSSDKPIASIMPVTGTQFPRQLTDWQRRQLKPKVADKNGKKP